ncbi:Ribitol 2-dehydrogenase [compost metagenome]
MLNSAGLSGKNVIVTGSSSGIGLETVKLLLAEGCEVIAAVRPGDTMPITHDRLFLQTCDVSRQDDLDALFDRTLTQLGSIDIFYANAGYAYCEQFRESDWQHISRIFETNSYQVFYSAQKLKQINGDRPFQFIATASAMAILPMPGYALYSGTKAAVRAFAHAYRMEVDVDQHFQVVYPISTRTAFFKEAGNSPVPWPSQSAEAVARAVVKGIKRKKRSVYPSHVFTAIMVLDRYVPFIFKIYSAIENKKFQSWLKQKERLSK